MSTVHIVLSGHKNVRSYAKATFVGCLRICYMPVMTDSDTAHVLASDLRVLIGRLHRRLREEAHLGDFTWSQLRVLRHLESEGPSTVTALAKAEGVRSQSMGETLAVLKAAGLVTGEPDPADGRQTVLSLTQACRDRVMTVRAAKEDWLFHAIEIHLADEEQQNLAAALGLMKRLIDL